MSFIKIGSIRKPIGVDGEMRIEIDDDFEEDFIQCDHFFVQMNGNYIPYFKDTIRENSGFIIKLEDVDSPEVALKLNLKEIYLNNEQIQSKIFAKKKEWNTVEGYNVFNDKNLIGVINKIEEYPQQLIAFVQTETGVILIPMVDEFIIKIQHNKKQIFMNLPDGLTNL